MAPDGYGARIRAARCFAGLSQPALAKKLGREVQWIKRREKDTPGLTMDRDLVLIADATKVPIEFLRQGWGIVQPDQPSIEERMEALENRVHAVLQLATTRTAAGARESSEDADTSADRGDASEPGHGD